jgi:predicted Zn finger-like uncharacterized protein
LKVLAPLLCSHVAAGGALVLAGILQRQRTSSRGLCTLRALRVTDALDGWVLMTATLLTDARRVRGRRAAHYNRALMSMLTCCPVCSTMFKVVPDQLRISQGWVRCGRAPRCSMQRRTCRTGSPALPRPPPGCAVGTAVAARLGEQNRPTAWAGDAAAAALLAEALVFAGRAPSQDSGADGDGYSGFTLLRSDDAAPVREGDSGPTPLESEARVENRAEAIGSAELASIAPEEAVGSADASDPSEDSLSRDGHAPPSFVQQARRRDLWRRPAARAALVVAGVLLATLLLLQYGLHHRDALAARAPVLAGPLRTLCQAAGCTIAAPRQIEAIVIDSSTFSQAARRWLPTEPHPQ